MKALKATYCGFFVLMLAGQKFIQAVQLMNSKCCPSTGYWKSANQKKVGY